MFLGDMGLARARTLCNYARCLVLLILGLLGNYDQPEINLDQQTDEMHSHKVASGENLHNKEDSGEDDEGSEKNDEGSENYEVSENGENSDKNSDCTEEIGERDGWLSDCLTSYLSRSRRRYKFSAPWF